MIDYAELVLKLKTLEKEYHDCMLKKDLDNAMTVSDKIVKASKSIQEFTKLCIETKSS